MTPLLAILCSPDPHARAVASDYAQERGAVLPVGHVQGDRVPTMHGRGVFYPYGWLDGGGAGSGRYAGSGGDGTGCAPHSCLDGDGFGCGDDGYGDTRGNGGKLHRWST